MIRILDVVVSFFVATTLGALGGAVAQVPPGFEVVILSESPSGFHSIPDINNHSAVTFSIETTTTVKMFLFQDGILRQIDGGSQYAHFPAINDEGVIAFMSSNVFSGPYGPTLYVDGSIQVLASGMHLISLMDINNSENVIWTHTFSQSGTPAELFVYEKGQVTQLTDNNLSNQWGHINSCGDVIYIAYDFAQSPAVSTVFLNENGVTTALTDANLLREASDLNGSGQMVWRERAPGGMDSIVLWENGTPTVIATGNSSNAVGVPRISGDGHVMFARWNEASQKWDVWLWTPKELFQLPDFGTSSSQGDMNDYGEGAWRALASNGTRFVLLLRRVASPGDFNSDCHIDLHDFAILNRCLTRAGVRSVLGAECSRGDFDSDSDVDQDDVTSFVNAMTGADNSIAGCVPD